MERLSLKKVIFWFSASLFSSPCFATVHLDNVVVLGAESVGTTAAPNSKAALDVVSTTKGVLLPRMTSTQRDAITSPPEGLRLYNSTAHLPNYYNGTSWKDIVDISTTQTLTNKTMSGSSNTFTNIPLSSGVTGVLPESNGGTNQSTYALGDLLYSNATNTLSKLSGNTTSTKKFLSQTGTGSVSAAPVWGQPAFSDITGTASLTTQVTGTLPLLNGGTGQTTKAAAFDALSPMSASGDLIYGGASGTGTKLGKGTDGQVLTLASGTPTWADNAAATGYDSSEGISNLGLATSESGNALTIALKQKGGSDPSTGTSAVAVSFRNATSATGTYSSVSATSALSVTVSSGSTLGHTSAVADYIYVYAVNNAGTMELGVSSTYYDDGSTVNTTAEGGAGAAKAREPIYTTTARTGVAIRVIGRLLSTQTTAGTWVAAITEISLKPFTRPNSSLIASGFFATTASCGDGWTRTNAAMGSFGTDTDCPGPTVEFNPGPGALQTTDVDLPKFTINNLPFGFYRVRFDANVTMGSGTAVHCFGVSDGTTTSGANCDSVGSSPHVVGIGYFHYTSTANHTFEFVGASSASSIQINNGASLNKTSFSVERL